MLILSTHIDAEGFETLKHKQKYVCTLYYLYFHYRYCLDFQKMLVFMSMAQIDIPGTLVMNYNTHVTLCTERKENSTDDKSLVFWW